MLQTPAPAIIQCDFDDVLHLVVPAQHTPTMQKRPTDASGCNRHLQEHVPTPRLNSWNRGNLTPGTATTVPTQPAWGLGMGTQQLGSSAKVCGSRTPCGQAALLRPALGLPAGRRCSPVLYRPGRASIRPGRHTVRCFSSACVALLHGSAFSGRNTGHRPLLMLRNCSRSPPA